MNIEKTLVQNKLLTLPCVYIRSDVDKALVGTLKDIVMRHKGTIADSPDKATHIIHPPPTTPPEGTDICVLCLCKTHCRWQTVHRYYLTFCALRLTYI